MIKSKLTIAGIIVSISLTLTLVVFPSLRHPEDFSSKPAKETVTGMNLGITYLRVTPALSAYYDLGIDSGVLVTEVIPGSPMDMASVQEGDVICSCNGVKLGEGVTLLGMMRECRSDGKLTLEVCRGRNCRSVECCPCCGTPDCNCQGPCSTINR